MSTTGKDQEPADSSSSSPVNASTPSATSVVRTRNGSMGDSLSGSIGIDGGDQRIRESNCVTVRFNLLTNEWFIDDVPQGQMPYADPSIVNAASIDKD